MRRIWVYLFALLIGLLLIAFIPLGLDGIYRLNGTTRSSVGRSGHAVGSSSFNSREIQLMNERTARRGFVSRGKTR